MKNKLVTALIALICVVLVSCIGAYFAFMNMLKPISAESNTKIFVVEEGSTIKSVLKALDEEEIIKNADLSYYYVRFAHPVDFKAGKYEVDTAWDFDHIVDHISNASNIVNDNATITFIEGEWLKHYATKLAKETNVTYDELMAYWDNEEAIRALMVDYPFLTDDIFDERIRYALEGYLFPNTYEFRRETSCEEITRTFLNATLSVYNEFKADFDASSLSIHEIFTLASILQHEGNSSETMKMIAGVFFNRLNNGVKLQSSSTVCYAIDYEGVSDWQQCEYQIEVDSPYNTYKNDGLTPGPILNPSKIAIEAVLRPTPNDYYFFIANVCGDGTIYFAKTLAEHEALIAKYLNCY